MLGCVCKAAGGECAKEIGSCELHLQSARHHLHCCCPRQHPRMLNILFHKVYIDFFVVLSLGVIIALSRIGECFVHLPLVSLLYVFCIACRRGVRVGHSITAVVVNRQRCSV
jgi:hypothetical protein